MDPDSGVVRSPYTPGEYKDTTESLTDYLFRHLRAGLKSWGDKPFIVDVTAGTSVKFCDLEDQSRRVASALSRRGFKQNDVLFFVTYELAQLYIINLAVWRLGGAVRGCFQGDAPEEYVRQLRQTHSSFVLIDEATAPVLREAISQLDWSVQLLSVGGVTLEGAISFTQLLQDDGTAMPEKVDINPAECIVNIPNTSGSTGVPKGVIHTHNTAKAVLKTIKSNFPTTSLLESMITYGIGTYVFGLHAICTGLTLIHVGKFQRENYFDILLKYKPRHLIIYPYVASWFARCSSDLARIREANFLEKIWIGGWVLDHTTARLLGQELPQTNITQMYGMTEITFFSITDQEPDDNERGKLTSIENEGQVSVSSGKLLPYAEAKIVDVDSGKTLPPLGIGELLIRTPCLMRGYLVPGKDPNCSDIDENGWFHSGDIAFFDKDGNIYIKERLTFMFKYFMNYVSPCELETVLQCHPAVSSAGVVGVPNPESDNLARALVVLRPECSVTGDELRDFVAERLPPFKHLHGGVTFVDSLPVGRAGKLDRKALRELALQNL